MSGLHQSTLARVSEDQSIARGPRMFSRFTTIPILRRMLYFAGLVYSDKHGMLELVELVGKQSSSNMVSLVGTTLARPLLRPLVEKLDRTLNVCSFTRMGNLPRDCGKILFLGRNSSKSQ